MKKMALLITALAIAIGIGALVYRSAQPMPTIRIGLNAWPGYEYLYLMSQKGFDTEAGFKAEIVTFDSLTAGRRSFERGEVDVLGTTIVEAIFAKANSSLDPKVFYVTDYSNGADVIVARDPYKTTADLKGKIIGVEAGSVCVYALHLALKKSGLTLGDVKIKEATQDIIIASFKDGTIDAAVTYPPFSLELTRNNNHSVVFTSKEEPKKIFDVLITSKQYLSEHREALQQLSQAFEKARHYSTIPGSDGYKIMATREKITEQEFRSIIQNEIVVPDRASILNEYLSSGLLQSVADETETALRESEQIEQSGLSTNIVENVF